MRLLSSLCDDVLVEDLTSATGLLLRMKGLLCRSGLEKGSALHISPCGAIHTFFMQFNIDCIFLDRDMRIVKIVENVPPFRTVPGGFRAHSVIELESGWFSCKGLSVGDILRME